MLLFRMKLYMYIFTLKPFNYVKAFCEALIVAKGKKKKGYGYDGVKGKRRRDIAGKKEWRAKNEGTQQVGRNGWQKEECSK